MNIYGAILGLGIALTVIGCLGTILVGVLNTEKTGYGARPLAFTVPAFIIGATLIGATAEQGAA